MISYLILTLPWTVGCLALSPLNHTAVKYRKVLAGLFFGTLVPLIYYFIQHKVHKVAGGERYAQTFSPNPRVRLLTSVVQQPTLFMHSMSGR